MPRALSTALLRSPLPVDRAREGGVREGSQLRASSLRARKDALEEAHGRRAAGPGPRSCPGGGPSDRSRSAAVAPRRPRLRPPSQRLRVVGPRLRPQQQGQLMPPPRLLAARKLLCGGSWPPALAREASSGFTSFIHSFIHAFVHPSLAAKAEWPLALTCAHILRPAESGSTSALPLTPEGGSFRGAPGVWTGPHARTHTHTHVHTLLQV